MSEAPRAPAAAGRVIGEFLRAHVREADARGVVVGLSGGVDSALVARLARDALGPEQVLGVLLPNAAVPAALVAETEAFGRRLGIELRTVRLEPIESALRTAVPEIVDRVTLGNSTARLRMLILYAFARERRLLVAGTGNKSELLLGYFTKYGDGAADLLPIGDLYKSDVYALGRELGLPSAVLERPPSAGFWEGQTDEGELGQTYATVDRVLRRVELLEREEEIVRATGVDAATVRSIVGRVERFRHKRRLPPVAKLGLRTIGLDWRE